MGNCKVQEGNCKCALCEGQARMYCESDDAMLCWDCDARVHGANFLVAKHTRALLCRSCRSPTTWKASGSRVTPTVSLCSRCCFGGDSGDIHGLIEGDTRASEDEEEHEEVENVKEEEEGDNQVVPRGMPVVDTITPPLASSSCSGGSTLKRARNNQEEQSSSPRKDHEAEPESKMVQLIEFGIIKTVVGREKEVSKAGRNRGLKREPKRSSAFAHASVSSAGTRPLAAFSSTIVAGETSMSCFAARQSISPPDFIQC